MVSALSLQLSLLQVKARHSSGHALLRHTAAGCEPSEKKRGAILCRAPVPSSLWQVQLKIAVLKPQNCALPPEAMELRRRTPLNPDTKEAGRSASAVKYSCALAPQWPCTAGNGWTRPKIHRARPQSSVHPQTEQNTQRPCLMRGQDKLRLRTTRAQPPFSENPLHWKSLSLSLSPLLF